MNRAHRPLLRSLQTVDSGQPIDWPLHTPISMIPRLRAIVTEWVRSSAPTCATPMVLTGSRRRVLLYS
jgi:hypothetical protein